MGWILSVPQILCITDFGCRMNSWAVAELRRGEAHGGLHFTRGWLYHPSLFLFLIFILDAACCFNKISDKRHFRKERLILAPGLRAESIMPQKSCWQECRVAGYIVTEVNKQRKVFYSLQLF